MEETVDLTNGDSSGLDTLNMAMSSSPHGGQVTCTDDMQGRPVQKANGAADPDANGQKVLRQGLGQVSDKGGAKILSGSI